MLNDNWFFFLYIFENFIKIIYYVHVCIVYIIFGYHLKELNVLP
jgi:hypothetical protein